MLTTTTTLLQTHMTHRVLEYNNTLVLKNILHVFKMLKT